MAFSRMTSSAYFDLPAVLDRESYKSDLTGEECSEESYAMVKKVVAYFRLKNQRDYHDLYLSTDSLALADVMETMRQKWYDSFDVDVCHYITLASASYSTMLKMTNKDIELLTERQRPLMNDIIKNLRGGVCCIFQPYARANNWRCLPVELPEELEKYRSLHNLVREQDWLRGLTTEEKKKSILELIPSKYLEWMKENGYNPLEPTTWIAYVDANSLYPTVMTKALPCSNFREVELPSSVDARLKFLHEELMTNKDEKTGFFVKVTYHVPDELRDGMDYAPVCKRVVDQEELSPYQRKLFKKFKPAAGKFEKLFPFLGEHRETLHHIELLRMYIGMGVVVSEVHSVWTFDQEPWMAGHVRTLTDARAATDDRIVKQVFKMSANTLFGKTCTDPLKQKSYIPHWDPKTFMKAAASSETFDVIYNNDEEGFFGLTL